MSRARSVVVLLTAILLMAGIAPASAAQPRPWPKGRITYVDKSLDHDAVKAAVRAWNTSGVDIRFVKVSSVRKARLVIKNTTEVPAGCGTGFGTLGYPGRGRKATIGILHGKDADGQSCAWPGQTLVMAHELGHVLGLEHNMSGCSLMNTSHTNGVAPTLCIGDDADAAKPGRWRCRIMEKVDLRRATRIYGGKSRVHDPEWCDAIDRIPATGPVTVSQPYGSSFAVTVTRAVEPALPGWIGTWGYGEPGYEVHATPSACTAVPGDQGTQVGVGLWGATPVGGSMTENLFPLPAGPVCLSVWQFDRGYNFAQVPTTVMVTGTGARVAPRAVDLPERAAPRAEVVDFD